MPALMLLLLPCFCTPPPTAAPLHFALTAAALVVVFSGFVGDSAAEISCIG